MDKVVTCIKCGGTLCYENKTLEITYWNCLTCGFLTQSNWRDENIEFQNNLSKLPQLYQDFQFKDIEGKTWIPQTMNHPEKFMVFLKGTSIDDAKWAGVLTKEVKPEEKDKFKKPGTTNEFYSHKIDMATIKEFGTFIEAIKYVGLI